jgi:hypothetical protein
MNARNILKNISELVKSTPPKNGGARTKKFFIQCSGLSK